jgi:hypothetical protein
MVQCRKSNVGAVVTFNEVKTGVEKSHGKQVTVN